MSDTVFTPMPEPSRRLEILTGAGHRRSWGAEQKASIVAESVAGGETVSAVARRHGLAAWQLYAWRRQACAGSAAARPMSFASVAVTPGSIEIVLDGATIRVPSGSDAATLRAVLAAVKTVLS
jgi:transposase